MTGLTLTPEQEAKYDLEVAEFGERVSDWWTNYMMAALYSHLRDRTWAQVLMMIRSIQAGLGEVPPEWMPKFDDDGTWVPGWTEEEL